MPPFGDDVARAKARPPANPVVSRLAALGIIQAIRLSIGPVLAELARLDPLAHERKATVALRRLLLRSHGERCGYCARRREVEAAHIVPLEIGETTSRENLILLCRSCHRRYDSGNLSIRAMLEIARKRSRKRSPLLMRPPLAIIETANPSVTRPPAGISPFLCSLHPFQRMRFYRKAVDAIERLLREERLTPIERSYLSIKQAELMRRRAVPGCVAAALGILRQIEPSAIPAKYRPLYYYELCYLHRLSGRHSEAARWARRSAATVKGPRPNAGYVAAVTNEILCEISAHDRLSSRRAARLENRLEKLSNMIAEEGGFWAGRWAVNCAVTAVELYLKLGGANRARESLDRLRDIYYRWDVRNGWDLAARPTITQLEGLIRITFPSTRDDLNIGIGLLARAFMTRVAQRQRPEGIRDVGFGLAAGLLQRDNPGDFTVAETLDAVMSRTVDGTSVQHPWRE